MNDRADTERCIRELLASFQRLAAARRRALGLSMTEEAVLLNLAQGMSAPSELSRAIGMTTAGMTNLLDRLEAGGLLRRDPHATDKRRVLLTLTKRGFRVQLHAEEVHRQLAELLIDAEPSVRVGVERWLAASAALVDRCAEDHEQQP